MRILKAISTIRELQNIAHVLTELESEGVTSLSHARAHAVKELTARHKRKMSHYSKAPAPSNVKEYGPLEGCPTDGCTGILVGYIRYEEEIGKDGNPVQVEIQKCEQCAYSRIKEHSQ